MTNSEKPLSVSPDKEMELLRARIRELEQQQEADRQALDAAKRAIRDAEAVQNRLIQVLEKMPDGLLLLDEQWRYTYLNSAAQIATGRPIGTLPGKVLWEEFPDLIGSVYDQQFHLAMRQQKPVAFEFFYQPYHTWFDINVYPISDGLAIYFQDITAQKQAEEARDRFLNAEQKAFIEAEAAKHQVTAILESITDAFFSLDQDWRFVYVNAQSEIVLQRKKEDLLGRSVWVEFPAVVGSLFEQQYRLAVEQQVSVTFEAYYAPLETWFDVHAYPTQDGLSVYYQPINERKQAEEERIRLLALTEQARYDAESALQVRNDFLSTVSHDLKTPLTVMRANVQLLKRRLKRWEQLELDWSEKRLETMETATTKMMVMVEGLLDIARLQAGQHLELEMRLMPLVSLIQQICIEQQETTKQHTIILQTPEKELFVQGDRIRLDRVFSNLIINAIKYSYKGGTVTVNVALEEGDGRSLAVVRIQDQGIGIPLEEQTAIFEPFYRAGNAVNIVPGVGVGLASASEIIDQHGGSISVDSREGQGSTFIVRLPCQTSE